MYSHLSVGEEYGGQEAEKIRRELWKKNDRGGEDGPFLKIKHDPQGNPGRQIFTQNQTGRNPAVLECVQWAI